MRADIRLLLLWVVLFSAAPVWCDDSDPAIDEAVQEDSRGPSLELLEFLGSWETDDGEWIDPSELDDQPVPEQEPADD